MCIRDRLNVLVSDEEMAARKAKWQPREPKVTTGYLARYASLVTSGDKGAILSLIHIYMREEGEAACLEVGIHGIHPELVKLLGRMKFRTSYGQNALKPVSYTHLPLRYLDGYKRKMV